MAEKRMFTKKVTDDDNFMSLSSSAQALYLHLSMSADDDGFCNQVSLSMFKAHASVQDLQALLEKRYIYQFENGVIVIKHWRMANALRKDRYTPTAFQEELAHLKLKDNGSYTWLPNGCQVVAERLPQNSIDKNSINKSISNDILRPTSEVERVVSEWNNLPEPIKKVRGLKVGTSRYKMLTTRIKEYGIDDVLTAVRMVGESDFLRRGSDKGWTIDFEWFVRPNNFPKILEGRYANKGNPAQNYRTIPKENWDSYMWNDAIKDGYATNEEYREWRTKNVTL